MRLKNILEDKFISALNLAQESGKVTVGLGETKKAMEEDTLQLLITAEDLENREKQFTVPNRDSFSKSEVSKILSKHTAFLKKKKKKLNIKKEIAILKTMAEENGIDLFEGLTKSRLGKAMNIESGIATCVGIIDYGRTKQIFDEIIKECQD